MQDEGCAKSTYQKLCVPGPILYLSRRTLERGLLSLCRGYTSESWSSPFYVSSGNRPSSPRIHLEGINRNELAWLTMHLKLRADRFQLIQLETHVTFDHLFLHRPHFHPNGQPSSTLAFCCYVLFGSFSLYGNQQALLNDSCVRDVYRVSFH